MLNCCACENCGEPVVHIHADNKHNFICIECQRRCLIPHKGIGDWRTNVRLILHGISDARLDPNK